MTVSATQFEIEGATLTIANRLPLALAEATGASPQWITWPDAPLPPVGWYVRWFRAPNAVWVVYTESDVADFENSQRSTAVRVDATSAKGFDLGSDVPIGADSVGLWLARAEPETDVAEFGAFVPPHDTPALADLPLERVEDLPKPEPIAFPPGAWEPEVLPTEPDPTWPASAPSALRRVGVDGEDHILFDRTITEVTEGQDGLLNLRYYAVRPGTANGGPGRVLYWERSITLPVHPLPDQVRVEEHDSIDHGLRDLMTEILERQHPELHDLRPDRLVTTTWTPRRPSNSVQKALVEWTRHAFHAMAKDRAMWTRGDDQWHRIASEYQELSVATLGDWPAVQVIAEFTHERNRRHSGPAATAPVAFRVIVELFDEAGLPDVPQYLTVYVEEDVETQRSDFYEFADDGRRVLRY